MSIRIPKKIRMAVLERDEFLCQRCGLWIGELTWYSLHHRDPRGAGGTALPDTMPNLVTLCGTGTTGCHGYVESNRTESYEFGWLVPNGVTPEEWPVRRFGEEQYQQPTDEWLAVQPHPWQADRTQRRRLTSLHDYPIGGNR